MDLLSSTGHSRKKLDFLIFILQCLGTSLLKAIALNKINLNTENLKTLFKKIRLRVTRNNQLKISWFLKCLN